MRLVIWLVGLLLLLLVAVAALMLTWGRDLPPIGDLDVLEFRGASVVYDRNGVRVGALTPSLQSVGRTNRQLLNFAQFSPYLVDAVVTNEDRRFYRHDGIDLRGLARALVRTVQGDTEGGSTLTQQLVKNTLLYDAQDRTAQRKFREAILAVQVERNFSKEQILTAYLNVIYWGVGAGTDLIGAETAAQAYFGKSAAQLNLAEGVYLAAIIPSPGRRYRDYGATRGYMRLLLDAMVEEGRITREQATAAWLTRLQPAGWTVRYDPAGNVISAELSDPAEKDRNTPTPPQQDHLHYMQALERELVRLIGRRALYSGEGLRVTASMDLAAQRSAERASRSARLPEGATLGMALMDPQNGAVLALVGQKLGAGRPGEWNNATDARRQVGSSLKPLLYTQALQEGWRQDSTVLDSPIRGDYQPRNFSGRYLGTPVTLRYALNHSLNLPTVRLAQEIGVRPFEAKLRELGLRPDEDLGLSLSLGTLEASPLQMAAAYAPFAAGGRYRAPVLVQEIRDARGQVLYRAPASPGRQVWDPQTAWLGLDMIRGVVNDLEVAQGGLASRARIPGWPVGGKTGTSNDAVDLWFVGVTPAVVGAVWVGRQAGGALPAGSYSGEVPTPVWQAAVSGTLSGRAPQRFAEPSNIEYRTVRGVRMAFRSARPAPRAVAPTPPPRASTPAPAPRPGNPVPTASPAAVPPAPAAVSPAPTRGEPLPLERSGVADPFPTLEPLPELPADPGLPLPTPPAFPEISPLPELPPPEALPELPPLEALPELPLPELPPLPELDLPPLPELPAQEFDPLGED